VPPVAPVQLLEVKSLREEVVDEGAEGDAVGPARREVVNPDALKEDGDDEEGGEREGVNIDAKRNMRRTK